MRVELVFTFSELTHRSAKHTHKAYGIVLGKGAFTIIDRDHVPLFDANPETDDVTVLPQLNDLGFAGENG